MEVVMWHGFVECLRGVICEGGCVKVAIQSWKKGSYRGLQDTLDCQSPFALLATCSPPSPCGGCHGDECGGCHCDECSGCNGNQKRIMSPKCTKA